MAAMPRSVQIQCCEISITCSYTMLVVSCPGKVLFSGGYLILDEEKRGICFALDKKVRAYGIETDNVGQLTVSSPQFLDPPVTFFRESNGVLTLNFAFSIKAKREFVEKIIVQVKALSQQQLIHFGTLFLYKTKQIC